MSKVLSDFLPIHFDTAEDLRGCKKNAGGKARNHPDPRSFGFHIPRLAILLMLLSLADFCGIAYLNSKHPDFVLLEYHKLMGYFSLLSLHDTEVVEVV